MRKHGGTPSRRDKHVTPAAICHPGVARGRFVGGQQSGLAGCKPPPLFTRGPSSCSSQGRRQGEPWGASPRPSPPTYLPEHDAFCVQTCVEEVENAEYVAPLKPLLSMRVEDPVDEESDPRSRLREYVDSKRRLVAKKLCYAKPTRSSWPLKQGCMGDLSQLKEDLE